MTDEAVNKEEKLARAVPFFGSGDPIPRDRDLTLEDDETPFKAVVRLLMFKFSTEQIIAIPKALSGYAFRT